MEKRKKQSILLNIVIFMVPILIACIISYFNIIKLTKVSGSSMFATLHDGQYIIFSRLHTIKRDDVVVAMSPTEWQSKGHYIIKRAIGVPGDEIKITETSVIVNGVEKVNFRGLLKENKKPIHFCLCDNNYFLVGDNVGHSYDSLTRYINSNGHALDYTIKKENILFGRNIPHKTLITEDTNGE